MISERQRYELRIQLEIDERSRDREQYSYTADVLRKAGITSLSIWPESNQNVAMVIEGEVDYDSLPAEDLNEIYKSMSFPKQQTMILDNNGNTQFCEAMVMKPCLKEKCVIYNANQNPPFCREYKITFKK